jgi:steroid delta-isomerase
VPTEPPALVAARRSWSAVQRKARAEWLELMADDVCIEDPIGASPLEPTGKGHCGKAAVAAFWDRHIAPAEIRIEPQRSFAAGSESAHLLTLTTAFPNGVRTTVTGIFTYRVNPAGKLVTLRGYWALDRDLRVEQGS